jgi:hypothetical protein
MSLLQLLGLLLVPLFRLLPSGCVSILLLHSLVLLHLFLLELLPLLLLLREELFLLLLVFSVAVGVPTVGGSWVLNRGQVFRMDGGA